VREADKDYTKEEISYALMRFRVFSTMTQKDMAAFLGCTNSMVSRWEAGKHRPSAKWLKKIKGRNII